LPALRAVGPADPAEAWVADRGLRRPPGSLAGPMEDRTPTVQEHDATLRAAWSLLRRNRDFRKLYIASVISFGGDWFLFVALGGLILQVTGKATSVALLIVSQELPIFLATPWAGWLVDRLDRKRVMIACDFARTAICAAFLLIGSH